VLPTVFPPFDFVVVAQDWQGSLVSILSLKLPLWAVYFPLKLHSYFNPLKKGVTQWHSPSDFQAHEQRALSVYLLSGDSAFLWRLLLLMADPQQVIVTLDIPQRGTSRSMFQKAMRSGHQLLEEVKLHPWVITDAAVGGGTNGRHLLGFGSALGSPIPPTLAPGLPPTLRHFLNGGVDGRDVSQISVL
jgi:hypothetical protein